MEYVDVAGGASVPKIGLGTWLLEGEACQRTVERALELGYRHFDTAQAYANEAMVGAALRASGVPREEVWITTKVSTGKLKGEALVRSTHDSLKRLSLDVIDLLLIHWPSRTVPMRESLGAMQRLLDDNRVRYIGVSNYTPALLLEALELAPIACIQVEHHPYLPQHELLAIARRRELLFTAYAPLARGRVGTDETLAKIGKAYGKTPAQVALRWLVQQTNVAAIPKASSDAHLRENIDVFDFELSHEDMDRVAGLASGDRLIDPAGAPWH